MDRIAIIEQINSNSNLLSLPQVLSELIEETSKEDYSAGSLAKIVLKDPSLTSRILKLANSSFYQRMSEIKTVQQAVSVLGVTTVKCFALSSSILHPDRIERKAGVHPPEFFGYVMHVAAAAETVAASIDYPVVEEALIAGLLHDVGIIYLLHYHPEQYREVLAKQKKGVRLIDAERELFGIDHCEIGKHLADNWNLPGAISEAISGHHEGGSDADNDVLSNIVRLAVLLTMDRFSDFEQDLETRLNKITYMAEKLGMDRERISEVTEKLLTTTVDMASQIGVDIGDTEQILIKANQEIWKSYLTIEHLFKERQELSKKLLEEERSKGAIAAKNVAMATLSHYLNNAAMAIYGRSQMLRLQMNKDQTEKIMHQLPDTIEVIDRSIKKMVAVLEEMKSISPIDRVEYYNMSEAMNIDDRVAARLEQLEKESGLVIPEM